MAKTRRLRVLDSFLLRRERTRAQEVVDENAGAVARELSDIAITVVSELERILNQMEGTVEPTDFPLPRLAEAIANDGRCREEAYKALSIAGRGAIDVGVLEAAFAAEPDSNWFARLAAHPKGREPARAAVARALRDSESTLPTEDLLQVDAAEVFAVLSTTPTPQLLERLHFGSLSRSAAAAVVNEVLRRAEADPDGECARYAEHSTPIVPSPGGDGPSRATRAAFRAVMEPRQDPIAMAPFLERPGFKAALRDGLEAWSHTIVFEACVRMLVEESEPRPTSRVPTEELIDRLSAVDFDVFDVIEDELKTRADEAAVAAAALVRAERLEERKRTAVSPEDALADLIYRVERYGLSSVVRHDPMTESVLRLWLMSFGLAEPR